MRKGFTLIELVVAVALLSMVLSFAGVIFNVSIESHRTASANAEIMRKLRAITDQLNTDFAGIRTDAPLLIWFENESPRDPEDDPNRYDQIMFFANGDFQSIQLYTDSSSNAVPSADGEWVLKGNIARIHYGQAQAIYPGRIQEDPIDLEDQDRMLARRQHILTADPCLIEWPEASDVAGSFDESTGGIYENERYEHDSLPLVQWKAIQGGAYDDIVDVCFDYRPLIDMTDPNTFHKLMCEGVVSFTIQWAYWDEDDDRFYWFPSDDPDGDGSDSDSHFRSALMPNEFGVYFNVLNGSEFRSGSEVWYPIGDTDIEYDSGESFGNSFFPKALKFTFRLYDSRGIIERDGEKGREFTHIVYLGG
jgi:prepilin-type N-terminal cleavage/methylation domain-containing protein